MVKVHASMSYFLGKVLVLAFTGYGYGSRCPGFNETAYRIHGNKCYQLHNNTEVFARAQATCFSTPGPRLVGPKDIPVLRFLNSWLLEEEVPSVWLRPTSSSGNNLILEASTEPGDVTKLAGPNERHAFVCQADVAVPEGQQRYYFPTFCRLYLEVTSSHWNRTVNFRLRYYKNKSQTDEVAYDLTYDRAVVIDIENATVVRRETLGVLEADVPVTAMLYRVDGQTLGGSLLLPILPESRATNGKWILFFVNPYQANYTLFLIGVKQQEAPIKSTVYIGDITQTLSVQLEEFQISKYSLSGYHLRIESDEYFNAFITVGEPCCQPGEKIPRIEQVLPVLASMDNVFLPVPAYDLRWNCAQDIYDTKDTTEKAIISNYEGRLINTGKIEDSQNVRWFRHLHYEHNVDFIYIHSSAPVQMKQYFRMNRTDLAEEDWPCRMDLLPVEMWDTKYAFNLEFINSQTSYAVEQVYLYIVYRRTSVYVGILLNDENVTDSFECSTGTGLRYFTGCIGSFGTTFSEPDDRTRHLSTNITELRFGSFLLLQTSRQLICRPLGFLDDFDNWIAPRALTRTTPRPWSPATGYLDSNGSPHSSPAIVDENNVDGVTQNSFEGSGHDSHVPTQWTFWPVVISESNNGRENQTPLTTVENQTLDTSTEAHQNTTFDDVYNTTPFNSVCRCFRVPHPCLASPTVPSITTEKEKQELVNEIKRELTVDPQQTSSAIRKKISADDKRSSSVGIGLVGVAMISLVLSLVILPDAITLISFLISWLF